MGPKINKATQVILRSMIINEISNIWDDLNITNTYEDDADHFDKFPSNENSKLTFEYESDELSEWLQKIADMLGIKYPNEFFKKY